MKQKFSKIMQIDSGQYQNLFEDIVQLIQKGQQSVAVEVNSTIVLLYWSIGKRINDELLEVISQKNSNFPCFAYIYFN